MAGNLIFTILLYAYSEWFGLGKASCHHHHHHQKICAKREPQALKGDRPVTAELALRIGPAFGQTREYWLNLQTSYDLKLAQIEMKDALKDVRLLAAS